jgi:iron-sulfur cluster assembly protein
MVGRKETLAKTRTVRHPLPSSLLRPMITLTDNAVQELRALLTAKQAPETSGLRLGVQRGGCAGLQYTMQVGDAVTGDTIVEQDGVRVFLSPDSMEFLQGCQIDYSSDLNDSGFKIVNPNAARSCGCGTSFEPKQEGKEPEYDPALDGTKCS